MTHRISTRSCWLVSCLYHYVQPLRPTPDSRYEHPRRNSSHHPLHIRSPGGLESAHRAAAAGAALAHAHPRLHAEDHAGESLHQLAAGPFRQLPRTPGIPRDDARILGRRRSDCRHDGDQSLRLLHRGKRRALAVRLRRVAETRAHALSGNRTGGRAPRRVAGHGATRANSIQYFPGRAEPAPATRHCLYRAHGSRHPEL